MRQRHETTRPEATRRLRNIQPVLGAGHPRSQLRSTCAESAAYGMCVHRNLKYFGYTLVRRAFQSPMRGCLPTPPRAAATAVSGLWHCDVCGDRASGRRTTGAVGDPEPPDRASYPRPSTPTPSHDRAPRREHSKSTFHEVQHTGRRLECWLHKTVIGLTPHVMVKMTSHTLQHLGRRCFGIDVQTHAAHSL